MGKRKNRKRGGGVWNVGLKLLKTEGNKVKKV